MSLNFWILLAVLTYTAVAQSEEKCPSGWSYFAESNSCFAAISKTNNSNLNYNFQSALNKCEEFGAKLATIRSEAENEFVVDLLPDVPYIGPGALIGLTRNGDSMEWAVGEPEIIYGNWNTGEPNNWRDEESCGLIFNWATDVTKLGKWNDYSCERSDVFYAVCKKEAEDC